MAITEVTVAERRCFRMPFAASLAVAVGDLLYWDNSAKFAKPATSRSDTGSLAGNQADFTPIFAGVAADQRLATETAVTTVASLPTGPSDRLVVAEGIFDCDCASAAWEFGDLIGVARAATPLNYAQTVIKVTDPALAIGFCTKREPTAVTKVRAFLSAFQYGWFRAIAGPAQGYLAGLGGTVTQASSKSTGVTLNKLTGQITMNGAALGAATEVAFTLTNSTIRATDAVLVNVATGGTSAAYAVGVTAVAAGSCEITVTNLSAGSLSEALVLNFAVVKGAAA